MLKIGLVGADSYHAQAFARLANLPVSAGGAGLPARVTALWGEHSDRARALALEAGIPEIVRDPLDLVGRVDAVMILLRHGSLHFQAAEPFLRAGIPTWVDKPFVLEPEQAAELIRLADEHGALLAGGSLCKYCPDVLWLRERCRTLRNSEDLLLASLNLPASLDCPYDGLAFYSIHSIEMLLTIFGPGICSVKADVTGKTVVALFKYADFSVCVNFSQVEQFYGTLYSSREVIVRPIDASTIYRPGFEKFVQAVRTGVAPEPASSLLRPVQVLSALLTAVETGREAFVSN